MGDPGPRGRFGSFGGRFVPEALVPACEQLEAAFRAAWADSGFRAGLAGLQRSYAGRLTMSGRGDKDAACLKDLIRGRR